MITDDGRRREWEYILVQTPKSKSVHGDHVTFQSDGITQPDGTISLHAIVIGGRILGGYSSKKKG